MAILAAEPDPLSAVQLHRFAGSYACFTLVVGAGHVLTETPHLQVHLRTTFFALNDRTVIPFDTEFTLFDLIAVAGRVITTDVQLALRIDQVAVHCRTAFLATTFGAQGVGFRVISFQHVQDFVFRHRVNGGLAALFRRQRITGATEEHAGTGGTNSHFTPAGWAVDAGQHHLVRTHSALFRILLGFVQLLSKITEEVVEHALPFSFVIRDRRGYFPSAR